MDDILLNISLLTTRTFRESYGCVNG